MLVPVRRLAVLLLAATACAPSVSAPVSASTSPFASPAPTATAASPLATATTTPVPLPTFVDIWAPTSNVVWVLVAGDHLFRSIDRGNMWEERQLPPHKEFNGFTVSFSSEREGWGTVFFQPGSQCTFEEIELYHTIDGAATWETLTWEKLAAAGILDFQCKGAATFADERRGVLTADDRNSLPTVYRTADGGRSWRGTRLTDPPGFKTQGGGLALSPGRPRWFGTTVVLPVSGYVDSTLNIYLYRSQDSGASWSYLRNIPMSGVSFVTDARWLRFVLPLEETTDGGATWHSFASDYSQAAGVVPYAVFADASVGYATVRGLIQRTVDGGAHWTAIKTPGT